LVLINPNLLTPHEDIDPENLNKILNLINETKEIKPIIVDYNFKIIIDGHHRWFASKILNFKKIPVIFIDYYDEKVKVGNWYIKVKKESIFEAISKYYFSSDGKICINFKKIKLCDESYYKFYWKLYSILQKLQKFDAVEKNDKEGYELPEVEKDYIIRVSKMGNVFPPKTTKHRYEFIIPQFTFPINELL